MNDYSYVDSLLESVELENMVFDLDFMHEGVISDTVEKCLDKFYNLSHYKLTREDLANPTKVKAAIKDMNLESPRNVKKRALPALIITIITSITSAVFGIKAADADFDSFSKGIESDAEAFKKHSEEKFADFGGDDDLFKKDNEKSRAEAKYHGEKAEAAAKAAEAAQKAASKYSKACFITLSICLAALTVGIIGSISDYDRMIKACDHSVNKLKKELEKETDKKRIKEIEDTIKKINETQNMLIKKKKDEHAFTIRNSKN